jgi:Coenzyme PQQ synthesis protein D (PqqD)
MDRSLKFVVRNPPIASESFGDEVVIVHLEKGTYYSVRGSAFTIWSMIAAGSAFGTIVDGLSASYEGSRAEIEKGVRELIDTMRREGLIQDDGPTPENSAGTGTLDSSASATKPLFENPQLEKYTDVEELLALDPIHDVDESGWPQPNPEKSGR